MTAWPIRNPMLKVLLFMLCALPPVARSEAPAPVEDWQAIIRSAPYWSSQGVFSNILDIRRWVLEESAYCSDSDRHLLFGHRGQFIGYISDGKTSAETQQKLNQQREKLARQGRATGWTPGDANTTGYPFALGCDQPHARLNEALDRYLGKAPADRLWGRWDDLDFASQDGPGNLHEALTYVYETRRQQQRLSLPAELPRYLAGMLLIESGGQTRAHSAAGARGIMQLMPVVLRDCGVAERNHWHRLAQLDCAMKLMNHNARVLEPVINKHFQQLPEGKRQRLFTLLLIQAYHGGAARIGRLMENEDLRGPARYFAKHHERFSAGDIAFGMVFHNLGRDRLGLASLYYVADVELATQVLCNQPALAQTPFCQTP
ncbi:lytic transglycosylase domain-containing protein [Marinobacter bryozoorum]|uniref:lytic transglycosylase domain-containing protein n=1 Tax=Marinobacter bryozoorum TaxID=256324 RepID=UPI0020050EAE|nr:lytic transglycosylase domain-containing protein [Marinobacter bryozoorum]MCK7544139.1 lytic transglycosylase domain-containing protein [Marinobacter bryozoorum]